MLIASQQKGLFKGGAAVIGVTAGRLLFQELDRRGNPSGSPRAILPDDVAGAKAGDASGGWFTTTSEILDRDAARLELKLRDGEKLKLMLMRGRDSALGRLGGGEAQAEGVAALAEWLRRLDQPA